MPLPKLKDIKWVTTDCYGTLIDWESGILACLRPLVPDDLASDFLGDPGKALAELIDVLGNWRSSSHFFRMK